MSEFIPIVERVGIRTGAREALPLVERFIFRTGSREVAPLIERGFLRSAEGTLVKTEGRQGLNVLERIGLRGVGRDIAEFVTPKRIVAAGIGGGAALLGFGAYQALSQAGQIQLGLGGITINRGDTGGFGPGGPGGGGAGDGSGAFAPANVAIGGAVLAIIVLGVAYLATRKKK